MLWQNRTITIRLLYGHRCFVVFGMVFLALAMLVQPLTLAAATSKPVYFLQVAAYKHAAAADRYAKKIHQIAQQKTRVYPKGTAPHTVYEVQIGPFANSQAYQKTVQALKKAHIAYFMTETFAAPTPAAQTHSHQNKTHKSNIAQANTAQAQPNQQPRVRAPQSKPNPKKTAPTPQPKQDTIPAFTLGHSTKPHQSPKPKPHKKTPTRLWNLRNVDIRDVIAEISRETGKNFIIDPRVKGKISIISSTPISAKEAYQVFLSALQVLGYAAIPSGKVVKIVPNTEAKQLAPHLANRFYPGQGDEIVARVIPVKNVQALQLVPILRPLLPQWADISAYADSNVLIAAGPAASVKRIAKIVQRVDTTNSSGVQIIPLHHASAQDLVATLKKLLAADKNRGLRAHIAIAADNRNNAILVSGSKTARIKLQVLISRLDKPAKSGTGNTQVIYLNYRKARDLVPILAGVARSYYHGPVGVVIGTRSRPPSYTSRAGLGDIPSQMDASRAGGGLAANGSALQRPEASTRVRVRVSKGDKGKPQVELIAEPNTNSIIINAPPTLMRILKSVIHKIDIRPAEVLVEALIVEVNEDLTAKLGIQWGSLIPQALAGVMSGGTSIAFQQGIGIINGKGIHNLQGVINALANDQNADILSTPSVVVLDNNEARIVVGQEVSIQDSTYPGNANGQVVGTPFTTFAREKVALHLYVTPQINEKGNSILLSIDQGNDTLANPEDPGTTPIINISSIKTSVLVNNGSILVLGGLIQNQLSNTVEKVPLLGDIPIIGNLFKVHNHSRQKRNLLVFLQPIIVPNTPKGLSISEGKYKFARQHQLDWLNRHHYLYHHPKQKNYVLPPWGKPVQLPVPFTKTSTIGKQQK